MEISEVKQLIKDNVKWEVINPQKPGGQSCGVPRLKQKLISEELDISIEVGCKRSALKNREFAYTLFEFALDKLIK